MAASKGIHILLANYPQNPLYAQMPYYSFYGPSQSTARVIINQFRLLENSNPYFHFYDAYNFGNHNYIESEFYDDFHLCGDGEKRISDSLNLIIHRILNK
jgi:hypothetical protein